MNGHDLAMSLRTAYLAMHRRTDALMNRAGVTADQFVVLCALSENKALTQRELVARTSTDPSTLRAMLVLLERRSLVARRPNPADRRARTVSLTPRGRRVHRKLWAASEALRGEILAALSPADVDSLVLGLRRLTASLGRLQTETDVATSAVATST